MGSSKVETKHGFRCPKCGETERVLALQSWVVEFNYMTIDNFECRSCGSEFLYNDEEDYCWLKRG